MRYATTGFQWSCTVPQCNDGSNGGFDGSSPLVQGRMEHEARVHANLTGHEATVDRMQTAWVKPKKGGA